ncbi:MAG TPA: hypothetical protein VE173_05430 [Longimicrobiales bacterium]|nr:hypothetical protein [Longimicrobiales bacterium]
MEIELVLGDVAQIEDVEEVIQGQLGQQLDLLGLSRVEADDESGELASSWSAYQSNQELDRYQ